MTPRENKANKTPFKKTVQRCRDGSCTTSYSAAATVLLGVVKLRLMLSQCPFLDLSPAPTQNFQKG
jgi:hypothetical protein